MGSARAARVIIPLASAALLTTMVIWGGLPLLRHDWGLPSAPDALGPAISTLFDPWLLRGLGEPQAYPTAYLLGFALWPFTVLPPAIFAGLLVFAIFALVTHAGAQIARALGAGEIAAAAAAFVAVLNPWVYCEIVAGHVFMLAAYGFVLLLAAELLTPKSRVLLLTLLSALLVTQIEFLVFAGVPFAFWLMWTRRYTPLVALVLAVLPIAFGLVTHYSQVRGTPYLLEWQSVQSVPMPDAALLRGYFARYDGGFDSIALVSWVFSAIAAIATVLALVRRHRIAAMLLLGWIAIVTATGTKWMLGPVYAFVVLHVPESGVFRELYDLLAFGAIAFTAGAAWIASMRRAAAVTVLVLACVLWYPWLTTAPSRWFVPERAVPIVHFPGREDERVALFPTVQPLRFEGVYGSGYDPDLFVQRGKAVPLNAFFPGFPEVEALARAEAGDTSQIEALGARYTVVRPYLSEDRDSIHHVIVTARLANTLASSRTLAHAYPVLGLIDDPQTVTIGASPRGNGIFFADAPAYVGNSHVFTAVAAPRGGTDAAHYWIDARLAFYRYPAVATRFGGAFTSSRSEFAVPVGAQLLAWSNGTILDERNRVVARPSAALRWWPLRGSTRAVHCTADCAVVASGDPPLAPAEGNTQVPRAVSFSMLAPWFVRASVPAHARGALRWAVRFEPSWTLFGIPASGHVRLDQDLNAWLIDAGNARTVFIVNVTAAIQFALEVVASCALVALLAALSLRARARQKHA